MAFKRPLILSLLLLLCCSSFAQKKVKELDLRIAGKNKILKILHTNADFADEPEWVYGDDEKNYFTNDSIVLTNSYSHFYPSKNCYKTSWGFVNEQKNEINITAEVYLCKEPPGGGIITWYELSLDEEANNFFITLTDNKKKPADKFRILKIEGVDNVGADKSYRITLLRVPVVAKK